MSELLEQIAISGFTILRGVYTSTDADEIAAGLTAALEVESTVATSVRTSMGAVYAARNIFDIWPAERDIWRRPAIINLLHTVLGPEFGLVRALFFDKPPERTWSLPWHRDLTIAVADHSLPSQRFNNPTMKAGVPHVQAPVEVLEVMLTLRIHLDDVTDENGPLQVIPGSHLTGKGELTNPPPPITIYAHRGDVLAMRPLVSHASGNSLAGTNRHRRILHLEFAASPILPDGFQWHTFLAGRSTETSH